MQFMIYDTNQNPEASAPPSPELMVEMGKFIEEATKAGVGFRWAVLMSGTLHRDSFGERDRDAVRSVRERAVHQGGTRPTDAPTVSL